MCKTIKPASAGKTSSMFVFTDFKYRLGWFLQLFINMVVFIGLYGSTTHNSWFIN